MTEAASWVEEKAPKTAPDDLKNCIAVIRTHHISLVRQESDLYAMLSAPGMAKVGFGTTNLVPMAYQGHEPRVNQPL